ncbi:MAG: hypothetical protein IM548_10375 [Chitinophagaceae bacterium]|jgi:hypothetical protein|nr:hypothetical protein [Cytophagales bacterium]MCA6474011.1 hypothetical protein [Chitinophagaceae bacterium]MCE2972052.1 hypothetical protein [Sediminibacterium sp.]MCA6481827.1 hypothetical protein [Chitinophagaceae bacterium]MCA6490278.1 hypothetical protein [Chitinophagaceae bacterium]
MLILLDIDGVMVPARAWQQPALLSDGFPAFSSQAVSVLKELIEPSTRILLTSSHRSRWNVEEWKDIFLRRDIRIDEFELMDTQPLFLSRKDEILHWLTQHAPPGDFIIIDDDSSLHDLPAHVKARLVYTAPLIGLTTQHLQTIRQLCI